jgi:hypothetical protein
MSKRKIILTIDCDAKTCGGCVYETLDAYAIPWCDIWQLPVHRRKRCPECIAAEVKEPMPGPINYIVDLGYCCTSFAGGEFEWVDGVCEEVHPIRESITDEATRNLAEMQRKISERNKESK